MRPFAGTWRRWARASASRPRSATGSGSACSGHEEAQSPWIGYAEQFQAPLALLCGAWPEEVVAMNSLSINLHMLLASFYRPSPERGAVLIEVGAFSSDRHIVASQIAWHGLDPARELIELAPRPGEECLRMEDIERQIATLGARLSLVLWPGVQYRTGQSFDLARIARAAHAVGAVAGFDLAHSIGNVPQRLHDDDADFAAWCSYKYLNGGPGAIGGAFVHARHLAREDLPRLTGWWGHEARTRFQMCPGIQRGSGRGRLGRQQSADLLHRGAACLAADLSRGRHAGTAPQVVGVDRLPANPAAAARGRGIDRDHACRTRKSAAASSLVRACARALRAAGRYSMR